MDLANITRPDISYTSHKLTHYSNRTGTAYRPIIKRVLEYLCGTQKLSLLD